MRLTEQICIFPVIAFNIFVIALILIEAPVKSRIQCLSELAKTFSAELLLWNFTCSWNCWKWWCAYEALSTTLVFDSTDDDADDADGGRNRLSLLQTHLSWSTFRFCVQFCNSHLEMISPSDKRKRKSKREGNDTKNETCEGGWEYFLLNSWYGPFPSTRFSIRINWAKKFHSDFCHSGQVSPLNRTFYLSFPLVFHIGR